MKIVHVTNVVAPDKQGGLERYVRELAAEQVKAGNDVSVIAKRRAQDDPSTEVGADGVRIFRYSAPPKRRATFALEYPFFVTMEIVRALKAAGVWERGRSACIHAHYPVPALALVLFRRPFTYTFHAPVFKEIAGERQGSYALPRVIERAAEKVMKVLERTVLSRADVVITLSDFVRSEAKSMGVRHERFRLIPGGLDVARFRRVSEVLSTDSQYRLFTARRLVERTGVEQLVSAMPAVLAKHPHTKLRIAGAGPRRQSIVDLIDTLGVQDHVVLLGRISEEHLAEEYRRATLAVTPTQYLEGFGLATAEALASGTPALVTPVGANPELVSALSPSLIARDATPSAISAAINALLENPAELDRIRGKASSDFAASWAWSEVQKAVRQAYESDRS